MRLDGSVEIYLVADIVWYFWNFWNFLA